MGHPSPDRGRRFARTFSLGRSLSCRRKLGLSNLLEEWHRSNLLETLSLSPLGRVTRLFLLHRLGWSCFRGQSDWRQWKRDSETLGHDDDLGHGHARDCLDYLLWWRSVLLMFLSHLDNFRSVAHHLCPPFDAKLGDRRSVADSENERRFHSRFCFRVKANNIDVDRDLHLCRKWSVVSPVALPAQICDLNRNSQHDTII